MLAKIDKNFIVDNGRCRPSDVVNLFPEEEVIYISETADMLDVLIIAGIYKNRAEAFLKWKHAVYIPYGFTTYRKIEEENHMLSIYNP